MRIREALFVIIGVSIMTFALSYFIYRLIFKKDLKNWRINVAVILCFVVGAAISTPPSIKFLEQKKGIIKRDNTLYLNGKKVVTYANAKERMTLPTAYDTIENTHPSVISFPKEWHGYKYWMGITAYPKGNAAFENPHVFKSNDLVSWDADKSNPLDEPTSSEFTEGGAAKQYDSDTHIIYNKEEDRIELFWRYVDDVNNEVIIYRMTTSDGKTWTEKEEMYRNDRKKADMVSPAIVKDKDGYKVWYVQGGYRIWYRESKDGKKWSKATEVVIPYNEQNMKHWHLDVQATDLGYEMVLVGFKATGQNTPSERHTMNVYYSKSKDNKNWDTLTPIIYPTGKEDDFDGKGLYRSALLKENGRYYVFYSGIGFDDTRGIGLAYGDDIHHLKGIDYSDYSDLFK